jgi:hypothetical protein
MSYFTNLDPINYDEVARDTNRHLRYRDYKHLQGVNFDNDREESIVVKVIATMGFVMCLIAILFIA